MKVQNLDTLCIHAARYTGDESAPLATPIIQSTSFVFKSIQDGKEKCESSDYGHCYTRLSNPTNAALEEKLAAIEGCEAAVAFGSGVGAISGVLFWALKQGDHVVADGTLYSATHYLFDTMLAKFGVETTFVDCSDIEQIHAAIRPNTRLIYCESPANPTMKVVDLRKVAQIGKEHGILTAVDATFASPYCMQATKLGMDIAIHSTTKYICGHGDAIGGAVMTTKAIADELREVSLKNLGACPSPFNSYLNLRGLKTLPVRMKKLCENTQIIAEYLETCPQVLEVRYPGLKSHPQHDIAMETMNGCGSVICFDLAGGMEAGIRFMEAVKLCTLAVSLGDAETLLEHPASMTHWYIDREMREAAGITDGLIRMSVGLEDPQDIIADIDQALKIAQG